MRSGSDLLVPMASWSLITDISILIAILSGKCRTISRRGERICPLLPGSIPFGCFRVFPAFVGKIRNDRSCRVVRTFTSPYARVSVYACLRACMRACFCACLCVCACVSSLLGTGDFRSDHSTPPVGEIIRCYYLPTSARSVRCLVLSSERKRHLSSSASH